MDDATLAPAVSPDASDEALLAEARAFLQSWDPAKYRAPPATGSSAAAENYRAWLAKVVEGRWAVLRWPVGWFGRGLSDRQARLVEREFQKAGAPGAGQDRTNLWANTLLACGTEALKQKLVGPLLRGEVGMCLLYSEPGAGSDLAGIRTRADRVGDHYVVNGQKVWTSSAATADYGMLIARTNWDVPKHRGISFFFCPMKQPGVEVRPLRQITNESHFNEVFLTDAVVPAENLLGELGAGWGVLQTALAYERSVMGEGARGPRSGVAEAKDEEPLIALAREAGRLGDPLLRQDIAKVIALKRLNALNNARAKADLAQGASSSIMSLGKLAMSRILHEEARVRTAILGPASLLEGPDHPRAEDANFLTLNAYFTSIGGGTDQIQRNIIGERVLGLPKEPEVDRDIPFSQVRSEKR
jgi:alkylation response protein AidB-like acyl-CoA dehydrogenase